MERLLRLISALSLIFVTLAAEAAPLGSPRDFRMQTKYSCRANGVVIQNKQKVLSDGNTLEEIQFIAHTGRNQALTFGNDQEYMIWPRTAKGTFTKTLNVLSREKSGAYKIVQEVDMGKTQKTKTSISLTVKDGDGDDRPVSCRIEMAWVRK